MPNNILINGRCFTRHISGVERYAHEISKRLVGTRMAQPKNNIGRVVGNLWEQFFLPCQIKHNELLWSPANAGPWITKNQVITIHDASVYDHPEWFKPSFAAWTRLSWKILAGRVKAIITVSNFSRERLMHHLQIPSKKIHVIYNGVGKPFEPQSKAEIEKINKKYEINKPYFLFVGTNEPRKNLKALLQAWSDLNLKTHNLILSGAKGMVFARSENISNINYFPDEDLPALYSGATALVIPSFYEGFGLTALEAMACGTPVIGSNTSAFTEVFGSAALFFDPKQSTDLAGIITTIIESKTLANTLRERGLQRATQFSWDQAARKTQSVLESFL